MSLYLPLLHLSYCRLGLGHCSSFQPGQAAALLACFQISLPYCFHFYLFEMKSKHIVALVGTLGLPIIALQIKTKLFTMAFRGLQNLASAYFSYHNLLISFNLLCFPHSLLTQSLCTGCPFCLKWSPFFRSLHYQSDLKFLNLGTKSFSLQ